MQQLFLDTVQLKVTNSEGNDVYINDIDNLKYRVIRAAHSVRDFNAKFRTYHWSDRDNPIFVRLVGFDATQLALVKPDFPPCIRSLRIQEDARQKKHRGLAINSWSYSKKMQAVIDRLNQSDSKVDVLNVRDKTKTQPVEMDIVSLHDDLDDAQELSNETKEESDQAISTYLHTYLAEHIADYTYAVTIGTLFEQYLSEEDNAFISERLYEVYEKLKSSDFIRAEFRRTIPKISQDVEARALKYVEARTKQKYPSKVVDHTIFYNRMFDQLLLKSKNITKKPSKKVSFSTSLLEHRLNRIKAIINYVKPHLDKESQKSLSSFYLFQPGHSVTAIDEPNIIFYENSIQTNKVVIDVIYKFFKSLEAKSYNSRLHAGFIARIYSCFKNSQFFRAADLTLEFNDHFKHKIL